jgi:hypothetical protein
MDGVYKYAPSISRIESRSLGYPPERFSPLWVFAQQSLRDVSLIEAYREAAEQMEGSTSRFFEFCLNTSDYYNGDTLSRGAVNHSSRSCMMSLERLIQAGFFQLYPEFEDAEGRKKWAKRVRELRQIWSTEQETSIVPWDSVLG